MMATGATADTRMSAAKLKPWNWNDLSGTESPEPLGKGTDGVAHDSLRACRLSSGGIGSFGMATTSRRSSQVARKWLVNIHRGTFVRTCVPTRGMVTTSVTCEPAKIAPFCGSSEHYPEAEWTGEAAKRPLGESEHT
ncbi:Voltage-dependent calcium channel [Phytophthora palmivora]|uniref:Voltage-dependent calcium channel n=1 Tax=Phytophthora palmivora TaxID=4796 RepID=A0A2P4XGL5_9STRA|nr:Voltage-dependent calcium channel [Phytophthora palmivora]